MSYQDKVDQYVPFKLQTDLSALTENERKDASVG